MMRQILTLQMKFRQTPRKLSLQRNNMCSLFFSSCELKGLEFDHKFILSSDDILNLEQLPKSILIIGSGAIGIEWARIFRQTLVLKLLYF